MATRPPQSGIDIDGEHFERLTVQAKREHPESDPQFHVYGWNTYERSSVLAGQPRKVWLDAFDTMELALAKYPAAVASHPLLEPQISLGHLPGPDDPVPGGMYPDDIA